MSDRICSLNDFISLLKGVKKGSDGQFLALCPGHHDHSPSLSVTEADDKILIQCFAGCQLADILKPLNLEARDLFLNNHGSTVKSTKRLVAPFSYEVEKGKEAFQMRRYDLGNGEKTFEAWHRTNDKYVAGVLKKGKYVLGMGKYKDKPILFHLPEIQEWVRAGKTIYLPEGEGKAEAIIEKGGAAATSPFGAGHNKWRRQYSEALAAAKVVILPDNDKPGHDFAMEKAVSLYGKAASVKVLELPGLAEKGDVGDWFDGGHTFEELERLARSCPEYEPPLDTKLPEIIVTDRHLRDITADALHALYEANKPERIFRRSGMLTRISVDEKGRPFTEALGESAFRGYLERAANFMEIDANGTPHPRPPPLSVVRDCLALGEWQFPVLLGITEIPVMRPDGTVLNKPGYDSATGLYYYPSPRLRMPPVPDKPTDGELEAAIHLALEPLADFPFDSEASQANAVASMLTPILRPMIDCPVPLALFDKPQQGTGASLLAEVISILGIGRVASMMPPPKTDEEWNKIITTIMLKGETMMVIDNIEGDLYSASLSVLLTSRVWKGRILGRSEDISAPNIITPIATGNNIRLRGDLPRRCIWVRMDAKMARPWLRHPKGFKHPRLIEWVLENRGAILAAILTIARGWVVAGMPEAPDLPHLGGYERYCRVAGGVLAYMNVSKFLSNLDAMYNEADTETPRWEGFFETWHDVLGDKSLTAAELVGRIKDNVELHNALPDDIADTDAKNYSVRLGQKLAKRNSVRYQNGLALVKSGEKKRAVTWRVVKFAAETSPKISFRGEVGEVCNTSARSQNEGDKGNHNREEGHVTSPNLTLDSKTGEVATKLKCPDEDILEYPTHPCYTCGCTEYWLTSWNEWLCSRCHPRPARGGEQ